MTMFFDNLIDLDIKDQERVMTLFESFDSRIRFTKLVANN